MSALAQTASCDSNAALRGPAQAGAVCVGLGEVSLAAACFLGYLQAEDGDWALAMLAISIELFAVEFALQFKRFGAISTIPLAQGDVQPALPRPRLTSEHGVNISTLPAKPTPPSLTASQAAAAESEASQDVAALMWGPLSDLLLAAMRKDPQGVRRIFLQTTLQAA